MNTCEYICPTISTLFHYMKLVKKNIVNSTISPSEKNNLLKCKMAIFIYRR